MLRKIKFSNFYSFKGVQEISFLAKKKKTYDYFNSKSTDQITKIASFVGGNASGKTNVMRVFSFLSYFVSRNVSMESSGESSFIPKIPYRTFFNNNKISKFYVEFEVDDLIFSYDFSIKENIIQKESLNVERIKQNAKKEVIFARKLDKITVLNEKYFEKISKEDIPKIREDISFITFIKNSAYSFDVINIVYDYFMKIKTNINEKGEINNLMHQFKALDLYLKDEKLKKKMEYFVRNFDIGLNGFEIKKEVRERISGEKAEAVTISILGIHNTTEKEKKIAFDYESRGTRALFFTLANILNALKNNNVIIIDEIESGFHPEALNKLISYFVTENDERNAQMIFSSHSLGFMNKLDIHQIYLVEKNEESESDICRLNKVKGIRSDDNFLNKYMTGAYGAFPKIRI